MEWEFIHCNRNGTAWTLDRHDRKVGEQIQTGKGPSKKQRPGDTTREPVDETEDLFTMELNDKQAAQSDTDGNETGISPCIKICSSERGDNIQHEAEAAGYSNVTNDGPEANKVEADASATLEELDQDQCEGWTYFDKIRQEIMTNAKERVGEE